MKHIFFIFYFISCLVGREEAARILAVFPVPSISHQIAFRPLTQELARRGHDVTVITPFPAFPKGKTPTNLTEIDVSIPLEKWEALVASSTGNKEAELKPLADLFLVLIERQIQCEEVQVLLKDKSKTFDLLLLEACIIPVLGLSHIYKVPVIQVSSFGIPFGSSKTFGASDHPLLYPSSLRKRVYNLTIGEKFRELYKHIDLHELNNGSILEIEELIKKLFGPNTPSIDELKSNVHMLFLNVHPIWEGNFPMPLSVVYMGELHQTPSGELPQDLKTFLESSQHGVIYMSFGTSVSTSTLPKAKVQAIVNVLAKLPYDILLKWHNDDLPNGPKNVKIQKWFPQPDVLRHPKIKLFITQGGLHSTDDAIAAGVPLLGIPMLIDQWYNVEKYVHHKIGVKLDFEDLDEESFEKAIKTVMENKSYKKNIEKLRKIMTDRPQGPLERAVWWTEYVLRHGGAGHLRSPAANISWTEYYETDFILSLLVILLTIMISICVFLYNLFKIVKKICLTKELKKIK